METELSSELGNDPDFEYETSIEVSVPDGATDIYTMQIDYGVNNASYRIVDGPDSGAFTIDNDGKITSIGPMDYATAKVWYIIVEIMDIDSNTGYQYIQINVENTNNVPEPPDKTKPDIDDKENGMDLVFFPLEYKATKKVPIFKRERFIREAV